MPVPPTFSMLPTSLILIMACEFLEIKCFLLAFVMKNRCGYMCVKNIKFFLFSRTIQSQIKPCLDKLNSDPDIDVKFFAQEALGGGSQLVFCEFQNKVEICRNCIIPHCFCLALVIRIQRSGLAEWYSSEQRCRYLAP